jgi:hypothetical protein
MTSKPEPIGLKTGTGISACKPEISRGDVLSLCIQRQTAAVRLLLRFFRFGILAFEVGERDIELFAANKV